MIKLKSLLKEESIKHGEFTLPEDHKPAMRVPKGGSMCLNCKFLGDDKKSCTEDNFIKWNNGSGKLPYPADEYCSDFYEPNQILDEKIMNRGSKYIVTTKDKKRTLGTHSTKEKALKQLAAIEINKHKSGT